MLNKLRVEDFSYQEMDKLLELFLVLYYKCEKAIRLNLLDDIDRNLCVLLKAFEERLITASTLKEPTPMKLAFFWC